VRQLWHNQPYACQKCGTLVRNIAKLPDVELQCPECGWRPVVVEEIR
jgi:DNA-directed RNA polymerase subunit RPC12/RpoP